ncbi:hypothetical protein GCM10010232_35540 [Streptomyces amakusaensis]
MVPVTVSVAVSMTDTESLLKFAARAAVTGAAAAEVPACAGMEKPETPATANSRAAAAEPGTRTGERDVRGVRSRAMKGSILSSDNIVVTGATPQGSRRFRTHSTQSHPCLLSVHRVIHP